MFCKEVIVTKKTHSKMTIVTGLIDLETCERKKEKNKQDCCNLTISAEEAIRVFFRR